MFHLLHIIVFTHNKHTYSLEERPAEEEISQSAILSSPRLIRSENVTHNCSYVSNKFLTMIFPMKSLSDHARRTRLVLFEN